MIFIIFQENTETSYTEGNRLCLQYYTDCIIYVRYKKMEKNTIQTLKGHLLAARALKDSMEKSLASTSKDNVWKYASFKSYMSTYQSIVAQVSTIINITAPIGVWDLQKIRGSHDTTTIQQQEFFESVYANLNILISFIEHSIDLKGDEIRSLCDFFQANLRRAVFVEPDKEKEIQDVVEQLLIGKGFAKGIDYDRETGRVKVSIKEVVPDFILPRLSMAIEVKLSKDKSKSKSIVDEINADIQAYSKKYSSTLFIVYDLGSIQDEFAFKHGLETIDGNIRIVIVKH